MTTVLDTTRSVPVARSTSPAPRARLPRPDPVSVNGAVIPRDAIGRETQHHPAAKPADAWQAAARALVVRELLLQEAARLGLAPEPIDDGEGRREADEEALVRQLVEREVITPVPDEATCRRVYEQRRPLFRSSDIFSVRHILIPAAPADTSARAEATRQAEALIAVLVDDPSQFPALAFAHSACPSKQHGGALGQISRGQTVPELESALAKACVGTVMEWPIESRYGVHVVVVDQKIDGAQLPFELVHPRIASWLTERSRQTAIRQYIAMLAGRASIKGVELAASASTLVQ
ncbi:MAG: peptidylprolyl isomerase [Hyphomicrobiaceae bacterium]